MTYTEKNVTLNQITLMCYNYIYQFYSDYNSDLIKTVTVYLK